MPTICGRPLDHNAALYKLYPRATILCWKLAYGLFLPCGTFTLFSRCPDETDGRTGGRGRPTVRSIRTAAQWSNICAGQTSYRGNGRLTSTRLDGLQQWCRGQWGWTGRAVILPILNFSAVEKLSKNPIFCHKVSQNAKFGSETFILEQIRDFEHPQSFLSEICNCLSEFCRKFTVSVRQF